MTELINQIEEIARNEFDGHWTVMGFTTNYRVGFSTPSDRLDFDSVPAFPSLKEALDYAIVYKPEFKIFTGTIDEYCDGKRMYD